MILPATSAPRCECEPGDEFLYGTVRWIVVGRCAFSTDQEFWALAAARAVVPTWRLGEPVGTS